MPTLASKKKGNKKDDSRKTSTKLSASAKEVNRLAEATISLAITEHDAVEVIDSAAHCYK